MKKFILCGFVLLGGCGGPSSISHHGWKNKVKEDPAIEPQEAYFELNTKSGIIFIRGYAPSVDKPESVNPHSELLLKLVAENKACQEIWNFNGFSSVGERSFIMDGKQSKVLVLECYLRPTSNNFGYIYEDLISHMARTDVIVSGDGKEFGVNYFGNRIKLSDHNAEGHFKMKGKKDGEGRSVIFWKFGLQKYYGVIGAPNPSFKYVLDSGKFIDTVRSTEFNSKIEFE